MTSHRIEKMLILFFVSTALCVTAIAQQAPRKTPATKPPTVVAPANTEAQKLPLRRVVLYKSGVGYFEHDGQVRGNEDVEIDLTSSQLDDVLTSLTALDLNGGRIVGASYNSQEPAGHQLQALPVPVAGKTTLVSLLQELRGARLEVHTSSGAFTGRLLSVEEHFHGEGGAAVSVNQISLLGDSGDVRSFPLDSGTNLRFADRELEQELARALGLLDSSHQEDTRHLVLSTTGTGEREVRVSYTSEVPVWKTTYRIVLPDKSSPANTKPLLQGWAVVDNTVGEDWNNVELSLAAGAPQSFIQHISQPYYAQRPIVPMPRGFLLSPQTHGGTMVSSADTAEALMVPGSAGGTGGGIFAAGTGIGSGSGGGGGRGGFSASRPAQIGGGETEDSSAVDNTDSSMRYKYGGSEFSMANFNAAAQSINAAGGNPLGDLFEYNLKDRVTIRKNQSALVPIVQTDIAAEKVSLWNAGMNTPRPLRALWFTNTSSLVLDGGSFNVLEGGAFAGEGLFDSIQPGEKRLISYAADLAMQVTAKQDNGPAGTPAKVTRVSIAHGIMMRTVESLQRTTYTVRNEDSSARTLVIEHPIRADWKLAADLKPDEQSATAYRFRMDVPAKETKPFVVEENRPTVTRITLTNLNENQFQSFVTEGVLTPEIENSLRQILAQKDAIAKLDADLKQNQDEVDSISSDQNRLRENMQALKGTAEEKTLTQRYVSELNDQETRLGTLKTNIATLQTKRKTAQQEIDATIEHLAFDTTK